MSGVALITGDTPLGRHMAARLACRLDGTDHPLRSILLLETPAPRRSLGTRALGRLRRLLPDKFRVSDLVQGYEREARRVFLEGAGPLPDWPEGCEIRRVPRTEANTTETVAWQAAFEPAVIVLTGAPIIRTPMLRTASLGVLNLHGSLLPHYRGTRVEVWQVRNGDLDKAGLTIHYVEPGVDTGDIVAQVPQAGATPGRSLAHPGAQSAKCARRDAQGCLRRAGRHRRTAQAGSGYRRTNLSPRRYHARRVARRYCNDEQETRCMRHGEISAVARRSCHRFRGKLPR